MECMNSMHDSVVHDKSLALGQWSSHYKVLFSEHGESVLKLEKEGRFYILIHIETLRHMQLLYN